MRTTKRLGRLVVSAAGALVIAVTVVAALPAEALDVSNEAQLRAAFADVSETEITLTADITLTDCSAGGGDLDRVDGDPLQLLGQGFTIEQTCADEGVIELEGTNIVSINDVTITGGDRSGLGGGIYTRNGDLTVVNSSIVDNTASGSGGGINGDFTDISISAQHHLRKQCGEHGRCLHKRLPSDVPVDGHREHVVEQHRRCTSRRRHHAHLHHRGREHRA